MGLLTLKEAAEIFRIGPERFRLNYVVTQRIDVVRLHGGGRGDPILIDSDEVDRLLAESTYHRLPQNSAGNEAGRGVGVPAEGGSPKEIRDKSNDI